MVNTELLDAKIEESGYKIDYICDVLGISRQAFYMKRKNARALKKVEMFALCVLLNIQTAEEKQAIFFASDVE